VALFLAAGCAEVTVMSPGASTTSTPAASPSASAGPSGSSGSPTASSASSRGVSAAPATGGAILPRGGREIFPAYRLVGYAGLTGSSTLGRLGTGPLQQRVREMERRARPYASGRTVMPVLEIIATMVHGSPGKDGKYRSRLSDKQIEVYLRTARKHKALLLLNIQPGRSEFLPEAKSYERWLREPDVGVALDPEWAMDPGQRPGGAYGHTTGAELNRTAAYLSGLVEKHDLPEKVMVYHQVAASVVRKESGLKDHPGVVQIKSVDGLGPPGPKVNTYRVVNRTTPKHVHAGFKLFFTEDTEGGSRLMSPSQVLGLKPHPEYVMYE
jgi:hypothetical protein